MARTKASVGAKIYSGKSSKARCSAPPPTSTTSSGSSEKSSKNSSGGNPVCQRETPKWQKPITNFFMSNDNRNGYESDEDKQVEVTAGTSKQKKPKHNVIESDEECESCPPDNQTPSDDVPSPPKNQELDESIVLEPLTGEDSHKIEEYYPKPSKGKGVGKKTKDKENINNNIRRNSTKRDLESVTFGEESQQSSKKVKLSD